MDFQLSKEHLMCKELFAQFAETEVLPLAQEIDEEERFPIETIEKMQKLGYMGIPYPKQYGGQGADYMAYVLAVEELAKVCATTSVIIAAHTSLCAGAIYASGTEEQKQKYLVPLCNGTSIGAFGLTEPNAGSDSAGQQTKAVLDGDEYVINGSKVFITNAGNADIFIVIAMTDKSKGNKGISAFIMERGTPGFTIGTKEKKMGIRGSATCELVFDNVRIPKENLLGKEGKGLSLTMKALDGGRICIAAQGVGIAQGALDETIKYVKERKQFGRSIAKFQNTQFQIAEMQTKIDSVRLLTYRAAWLKQNNMPHTVEASMAKYMASKVAMEVTTEAVQLHGGYGYTREYPVERMMRDAKITEIYDGTSEIQKIIIASRILK